MQRHLGGDAFQSAHLEGGDPHSGFDRAVGMLDGHAADGQLRWIFVQPFLDALQHVFMLPQPDALFFTGRAFVLDHAIGAGSRPV